MLDPLILAGRVLAHALLALALVGLATLVGRALLAGLGFRSRLERAVMAAVVGLGAVGTVLSLLALSGLFRPPVVAACVVGMALGATLRLRGGGGLEEADPVPVPLDLPRRVVTVWVVAGALLVLCLWTLAVYPPTAFDDTMYHLPYVASLLEEGRLVFLEDRRFPIFPQLNEVLFATLMLVGTDVAPQYLQSVLLLLLGLTVFVWARRREQVVPAVGAAALALGAPLLVWVGTIGFVEVTLALFVAVALLARERWAVGEGGAWLLVAGALLGCAAGTKYHGLFFLVTVGATESVRGLTRRQVAPVAGFWGLAAVTGGVWYLRNALVTGNPTFPFMTTVFGENEWASFFRRRPPRRDWSLVEPAWEGWDALAGQVVEVARHLGGAYWRLLRESVWPTAMPPLSLFWLILLPVALIVALRRRSDRFLAVVVLGFLAAWSATMRDPRYLASIVPLVAVVAVPVLGSVVRFLKTRLRARCAVAALLPVLLLGPAYGYSAVRAAWLGPPPIGAEDREAYLGWRYAGYSPLRCLERQVGEDSTVYGIFMEFLPYYAAGRLIGDWNGPFGYRRTLPLLDDPPALAAELEEMGAGYLLIAERPSRRLQPPGEPAPPPFERLLRCDRARLYSIGPHPAIECECEPTWPSLRRDRFGGSGR